MPGVGIDCLNLLNLVAQSLAAVKGCAARLAAS
jgi:hypothetical protein